MRYILSSMMLLLCLMVAAQAPQKFSYQAVVRDAGGGIVPNHAVGVRFTIHDSTANGVVVYYEEQTDSTNQFGLFSTTIGSDVQTGNYFFPGINWAKGAKFLQVEIDAAGGTNYTNIGTSQLLSQPYALYAEKAGSVVVGGTGSAFRVYNVSSPAPSVPAGGSIDLPFNTTVFDDGNNFNTGTGIFTAPETGYYHFDANVAWSITSPAMGVALKTYISVPGGGANEFYSTGTNAFTGLMTQKVSLNAYLTAGQMARVTVTLTNQSAQSILNGIDNTSFSGYKIY